NQGASAIDEMGGAPLAPEAALISQTMEMDADSTAVLISLSSEWAKVSGTISRPYDFYRYPGQVMLFWSYAVSSLCRIFGDARLAGTNLEDQDHPPWRLRSVMIQQA